MASASPPRIELLLGDIVAQDTDAIVNAANTKLDGGGGVDGAIHRAAGPALRAECLQIPAGPDGRRCPTGEVRVTHGGALAAKWVIHAVGPFYNAEYAARSEQLLHEVYLRALRDAAHLGCRSLAFPAISTGAYRFPMARAAEIALRTTAEFLHATPGSLELVRFVLHRPEHLEVWRTVQAKLHGVAPRKPLFG